MATFTQAMDSIVSGLQAAYPTRVVTRERRKFKQFTASEVDAGLYVVNSKGATYSQDGRSASHQIQLVGLLRLTNPATDEQVEEAEFTLFGEVQSWVDTHNTTAQDCANAGFQINIVEFTQSPAEAKPANIAVIFVELERLTR